MAFDLATAVPVEAERPKFDLATAKPVEEEAPERPLLHQAARAVGRTARAGLRGATELVGTVANAPAAVMNAGLDLYDRARSPDMGELVTGKQPGFRFPDQTKFGHRLADFFGLPKAESANERIAEDAASGMVGAGGMVKAGQAMGSAGNALVRRVGEVLASRPGIQVAAGATGPGAASVVREEGGGPGAQLAAGAAGAFAPSTVGAAKGAVQLALRGREATGGAQRVADAIKNFEGAGAGTPTVGQATEGRLARAVESTLAKAPMAAGRMATVAEREAAGMGQKVDDIAASLAPRTGAEPAGRAIRGGMEDFVEGFKARAAKLYDKVDRHIPPDTRVQAGNTLAMLDKLTKPIAGAMETSALIQTPKLAAVRDALAKDAGPDGLPYQALKELRSAIGAKLSTPSLVDDVPTGQWKQLYGALTKDMGAAARAAGPKAEQAMVKASNYYRGRMGTIENVLQPILKKADPEDVFKAAISGTNEGATTIRGVVKSIPPESRKMLAATVLRRLGKATAGKQDELGEVFSTEAFLTNWNRISPEAKKPLFAALPSGMRADLDRIAKVAANIREGSKVFANPSGTTQAALQAGTAGSAGAAIVAAFLGQPLPLLGITGGLALTNGGARLMTNPKFVRFLSGATRVPVEQLPAQANLLAQLSWTLDKEDRGDALKLASALRKTGRQSQ